MFVFLHVIMIEGSKHNSVLNRHVNQKLQIHELFFKSGPISSKLVQACAEFYGISTFLPSELVSSLRLDLQVQS